MSDQALYTVGWISAIKVEYVAAQALLDERHDDPSWVHPNDDNHYTLGRIGKHNIAIAILPKGSTGLASAAMAAKDMCLTFPNIRIGLMVGVGGGVPSPRHDIRLGDVVVSVPRNTPTAPGGVTGGVVQFDYARTVQAKSFQSARYLDQPPRALTAAVHGLESRYEIDGNEISDKISRALQKKPRLRQNYSRPSSDMDNLFANHVVHQQSDGLVDCLEECKKDQSSLIIRIARTEDEDVSKVHYGLIGSSDSFMQDAGIRDSLASDMDILCFEMEAAGLMNHFPCIVIRGICDYADSHWNERWRGYAAMAAATYTKDLINQVAPNKLEAEKSIGDLVEKG